VTNVLNDQKILIPFPEAQEIIFFSKPSSLLVNGFWGGLLHEFKFDRIVEII
jgi:hypothetical protein